jgi:hypothetical protein|tara:strand:+ start:810 stop:1019 length:210 start_codon:yes stop_codon:yes gene_type:complete
MRPPEVIKQLNELRESWKKQSFTYTKEQQIKYDQLIKLRRERVKYFHDNDLVSKGSKKVDKTVPSNPTP